jgi:hypothetical protein
LSIAAMPAAAFEQHAGIAPRTSTAAATAIPPQRGRARSDTLSLFVKITARDPQATA